MILYLIRIAINDIHSKFANTVNPQEDKWFGFRDKRKRLVLTGRG